jgi:hypothetical protein
MDAEENLFRGMTLEEGAEGGGANVIQSEGARARVGEGKEQLRGCNC